MVTKFLRDLLDEVRRSGLEPESGWAPSEVEDGVRDVTQRVAELWSWIGFGAKRVVAPNEAS